MKRFIITEEMIQYIEKSQWKYQDVSILRSNPYNPQAEREKVLDNLRKFLLAYSQGLPGFVYVYNVEEWINEEELRGKP